MSIRDLENAVINAAIELRRAVPGTGTDTQRLLALEEAVTALMHGCAECNHGRTGGHRCPGCGADVPHAGDGVVCDDCDSAQQEGPGWVLRTWLDVRSGDTVRLPGSEHTARIFTAVRLPWHVHPAANPYRPNEMPAEWTAIRVRFESDATLRDMDPAKPVEILLSPGEVAAIEALGWNNRMSTVIR